MGHRRNSAPRRGSIAYRPRGRASNIVPAMKIYGKPTEEKPVLLGYSGYKAGVIHLTTIDDREKTPNFGKPILNAATVVATPPITISGFRAYCKKNGSLFALTDILAKEQPKEMTRKLNIKANTKSDSIEKKIADLEQMLNQVVKLSALVYTIPRDAGLPQKKPYLFEIEVGGSDIKSCFDFLKSMLGKEIKISDIFTTGTYVDVSNITKGKGIEGPVTRFGIKKKQHKSRKTVRAVGTLGPWRPSNVMYTVPRAGQRGNHHRTEYNKQILLMDNAEKVQLSPSGGFNKFGVINGDYTILKGSIPGAAKRLVRFRYAVRPPTSKNQPPKILGASIPITNSE